MKKLLMALTAAFAAITLMADTWTDPDTSYTWTYTINGGRAEIENGTSPAISPLPSGDVTVPSTLGGKSVMTIGSYAFTGCTGLTEIEIPASVMTIRYNAFDNCSGLMRVQVDAGNAFYKSVNGMLLTKDGTTLVQGINGGVTIPDGVTTIGRSAFWGCSELWNVTIPSSVTTIEPAAFGCCYELASVVIPSSVTTLGGDAFINATGLKRVTLSQAGVDNFKSAFSGYSGLKVVISDGVTAIGDNAFKGRTGIKSVLIPGSVTTIGESAFEDCTGLDCLSICSGVTTIKAKAFKGCTSLDYVTIPSGVSDIGTDAFGNCTALSHAHLPYTGPFYGNSTLVNDIFSGTTPAYYSTITKENVDVAAVDDVGFAYTSSFGIASLGCKLTGGGDLWAIPKTATGDLIIPATLDGYPVTVIRASAFKGCAGLERVTVPSSVTSIASDAFDDCSGLWFALIPAAFESSLPSFSGCGSVSIYAKDVTVTRVDGILWTYAVDGAGNATLGSGCGGYDSPDSSCRQLCRGRVRTMGTSALATDF